MLCHCLTRHVDSGDDYLLAQIVNCRIQETLTCTTWIYSEQPSHASNQIPCLPFRTDLAEETRYFGLLYESCTRNGYKLVILHLRILR